MEDRRLVPDEATLSDETRDPQVTRRSLIERVAIKHVMEAASEQQRFNKHRLERGRLLPGETLFERW